MKSSLIGIGSNLALAPFKFVAGFLGHSFALVADGVESLSDVVSSTVVFFGLKFAIKPPDEDHPYGHGKAEPIAAIIVSLALIAAAGFIGAESIRRIQEQHPLPKAYTLWVLLAVVGIKLVLSRYVTTVGKELESTAVQSDAWHHLSDAITSAFCLHRDLSRSVASESSGGRLGRAVCVSRHHLQRMQAASVSDCRTTGCHAIT
jgi:cation diffusion facilitator family transporter